MSSKIHYEERRIVPRRALATFHDYEMLVRQVYQPYKPKSVKVESPKPGKIKVTVRRTFLQRILFSRERFTIPILEAIHLNRMLGIQVEVVVE